jgi:hypothetical protein
MPWGQVSVKQLADAAPEDIPLVCGQLLRRAPAGRGWISSTLEPRSLCAGPRLRLTFT